MNTSAEQTASIKKSMQDEKCAKDEVIRELVRAENVLKEGRRAIGDHFAPNDCYATGPTTGDPTRDLVECPACSFIALYDEYMARAALRKAGAL